MGPLFPVFFFFCFVPGLFISFHFVSDRGLDFFFTSSSPKRKGGRGSAGEREADFHKLTPSNIDNHFIDIIKHKVLTFFLFFFGFFIIKNEGGGNFSPFNVIKSVLNQ